MGPLDILKDVVSRLEKLSISYFLVGSLGAMYYSRPRFTNDIDLVIQISAQKIKELEQQFPIEEYYCPPFEIIRDEVMRRGSFNLLHQATGVKIDIVLQKDTEFSKTEFSRRKKVSLLPGFEAYIATPEDIVLKKLDFYREGNSEKHLEDVREIMAATSLDLEYIQKWVSQLRLEDEWKKAVGFR